MMTPSLLSFDPREELIVDNFAGGGGASTGIEMALGRCVDHAINHDPFALGMHRINHPQTVHHTEDVFAVDPAVVCHGRRVGLCHSSPDCKHHSKAKGGKPVDKRIRGLCLSMLLWAKYGARVLTMENVEEIADWGPLKWMVKKGKPGWYPDLAHKGRSWQAFLSILGLGIDPNHPDLPEFLEVLGGKVTLEDCVRGFGYMYQARILRACPYGTPTIRKRLYMVARRDGRAIVWPAPSHFDPKAPRGERRGLKPYAPIAQCIDWERPCPSIFLDREQAKRWRCKRPLARPTLKRIAKGVDQFVLRSKKPFLVSVTHQGGDRVESTDEPARTVTGAHRGEKAVVVSRFNGDHPGREDSATRNYPVDEPTTTLDTSNRIGLTEVALCGPDAVEGGFITECANASTQRNMPVDEPARTICGEVKGGHFAVVSANLMVNNTHHTGAPADGPSPTVTTGGHLAAVTGTLVQTGYGEREGQAPRALDPEQPLGTIVAGGGKHAVVTGTLVHTAHGEQDSSGRQRGRGAHDVTQEPMPTVLASNDCAVVTGTLVGAGGRAAQSRPRGVEETLHTVTAKADTCLAAVNMVKLRGEADTHPSGSPADEPGHTISAGGKHHGVVATSLIRHFGESVGQPCDAAGPTVMPGGGGKTGVIAAHLTKFNTGSVGSQVADPAPTIPAGSHRPETHGGAATPHGVAAAYLAQHNGGFNETPGHAVDQPVTAITGTGSQQQVVAASAVAYYGSEKDGQSVDRPARTLSTKPRLGWVESTGVAPMTPEQLAGARQVAAFLRSFGVQFMGEFATVAGFVMVDIGMRMLTPRELFRAQGFGNHYVIDRAWVIDPKNGSLTEIILTKEQQIRMCGNSVCPQVMEAIVRSNVPELAVWKPARRAKRLAMASVIK